MKNVILILVLLPAIMLGRVDDVGASSVWHRVNETCMAVILFYHQPKPCKDPCLKREIEELKHRFRAIACNKNYTYAKVKFHTVNASYAGQLMRELGIARLPALVTFSGGKPRGAALTGDLRELAMHDHIDKTIGRDINTSIEARQEYDEKVEEAKLCAYSNSIYCYPYGMGGWGMGGCGWGMGGCGFGWGGGCGFGRRGCW